MYRGRSKHILDWTNQPDFIVQLLDMVLPVRAAVTGAGLWMPRGYRFPDEARLESFGLDRDCHYQLSNRIAFTWKLASLRIPTVLVYLGFLGDSGIADVAPPFEDDADWRESFWDHAAPIVPQRLFECRLDIGNAPAWFPVRSWRVLEVSPKADS